MKCAAHGMDMCKACGGMMAEGGEVEEMGDESFNEEEKDSGYEEDGDAGLVDRIMKQFAKGGMMMSEGGEVANDVGEGEEADMEPNQFDDLAKDGGLESHIMGNQEMGDSQETNDRHDLVVKIMNSLAKKDRMPSPA